MRFLAFLVALSLITPLPVHAQPADFPASFRELLAQLGSRSSPFPAAPLPSFERLVFHETSEAESGADERFFSGNMIWQGLVRIDQSVPAQLSQGLHASIWHLRSADRPGQRGSRVLTVTAMGGLVQLGSASEQPSKGDPPWTIMQFSEVSGRLFPLQVGNRLSYSTEFKGQQLRSTLAVTERLDNFPPTPWLAGPFWVIRHEGSGYNYPLVYSEKLGWVVQRGNVNRLKGDPMPQILRGAMIGGVAYGDQDEAITHRDYARSRPGGVALARLPEGWRLEQIAGADRKAVLAPPPASADRASADAGNERKAICNQRYEACIQSCEQRHPFGQVAAFSACQDRCEEAIQACFAGNDRAFLMPGNEVASPSAAPALPRSPQAWPSPIPPPRPTPGVNVPPPPVGPLPGGAAPRTPGEPVCHLWTHEPLRCLSRCVSGEPGAVGREVRMANCHAGGPGAGSPPAPGAPVIQPGGGYRHRPDRVANQCISMRGAYFVNRCGYRVAVTYCANWPGNAMSCGGPDFTKGSTSVPPNSERLSAIGAGQFDGRAGGNVLFMACRGDLGNVSPVLRAPNDGSCMASD